MSVSVRFAGTVTNKGIPVEGSVTVATTSTPAGVGGVLAAIAGRFSVNVPTSAGDTVTLTVDVGTKFTGTLVMGAVNAGQLVDLSCDIGTGSMSMLGTGTPPPVGFTSGRWYVPTGNTGSTITLSANVLYTAPLLVLAASNVQAIGVNVTGAGSAGSVIRMGIFSDNGTGSPGPLLLDAGTAVSTGTGAVTITISQALKAGLYWVGAVGQGGPVTQPTVQAVYNGSSLVGMTSLTDGNIGGYQTASVTAGLASNPSVSDANPAVLVGLEGT